MRACRASPQPCSVLVHGRLPLSHTTAAAATTATMLRATPGVDGGVWKAAALAELVTVRGARLEAAGVLTVALVFRHHPLWRNVLRL